MNLGDSQDGLQIYRYIDNFDMFVGYFRVSNKPSYAVETRLKRLYTTKSHGCVNMSKKPINIGD